MVVHLSVAGAAEYALQAFGGDDLATVSACHDDRPASLGRQSHLADDTTGGSIAPILGDGQTIGGQAVAH